METIPLNDELIAMKDAYLRGKIVPDLQIALASYTALGDYAYKALPEPPAVVVKFDMLPSETKAKMRYEPTKYSDYWNNPEVWGWYSYVDSNRNHNQRNKDWLLWLKKVLHDQPEKLHKINILLEGFKGGIEQPAWSE